MLFIEILIPAILLSALDQGGYDKFFGGDNND